jgi:hypothetical protein
MAVSFGGDERYKGCVIDTHSKYWLDGMLEELATVWDIEKHEKKVISFGYYGIDGTNLRGGTAEVDLSSDVARDILRTYKSRFLASYEDMMRREREKLEAGRRAVVVRGRKVPKGTKLDLFWVGERETYRSRQYTWMHDMEPAAGGYDSMGNKVWIKADYLQNITPVASLTAKERKLRMKDYVKNSAGPYVLEAARAN